MSEHDLIIDGIKKDITAFADPGTSVDVSRGAGHLSLKWQQNGLRLDASVHRSLGALEVEFDGRKLSYESFLASDKIADLKRLAETIVRTSPKLSDYVATRAVRGDDVVSLAARAAAMPATDLIREMALEEASWATRVVFLKGGAGAGKTYALRKVAAEQARAYTLGETNRLFLYVDAQGRALSRLHEAIAAELDDLRAPFTYHAVAPLVRRGCLVVIVDGFDELLGVGGYDEAFSSLSSFVAQLQGSGTILASARSSFYDYQGFRIAAGRFDSESQMNYSLETLNVLPWDKEQVIACFDGQLIESPETTYDRLARHAGGRNAELLQKAFYATRIADLLAMGYEFDADSDLLPQVVDQFIQREMDKLKDAQGLPILSKAGHARLLREFAQEMWWQETRRIDIPTLKALTEGVGEELKLTADQIRVIVERVPTYAFLAKRGDSPSDVRLGFEHEVFFSHFLAVALVDVIGRADAGEVRRFLSRSTLEPGTVEEFIQQGGAKINLAASVAGMSAAVSSRAADEVARRNAGKLFTAQIQDRTVDGIACSHFVFEHGSWAGSSLRNVNFTSCSWEDMDLSRCGLLNCRLEGTSVMKFARVDPRTTRFDGTRVDVVTQVVGLESCGDDENERTSNPLAIAQTLRALGAVVTGAIEETVSPAPRPASVQRTIKLLFRLLRRMERTFRILPSDPHVKSITGNAEWQNLQDLLLKHELFEWVTIEKSGSNDPLLQPLFRISDIEAGENTQAVADPHIRAFWNELLQG